MSSAAGWLFSFPNSNCHRVSQVCVSLQGTGTMFRHLERREQLKRLSLDSVLPEYMDANKCIDELLKQLEEERRNVRREKLAVARLQREVARSKSEGTMREKLIHELEEERRLRLESEKRLREVTEESEVGQAQMVSLQQQFSRMEETVRSLLQNQGVLEQTAVDTVDIMKAYKEKLSEEVQKWHDGPEENGSPPATQTEPDTGLPPNADPDASQAEEDKDKTKPLLERLKALEEKNSALALENESQREQYERCLDEVANQVVQALLTQKDLREECLKLRTRVFDLEQQNRALGVLFQQRIKPASDMLLQKLHSRIMDLSAADLLLEPERSKAFLLSRNTDSPSNELQLNGKAGLPVAKCLSQLSLTVPAPVYPRSSCSSSELSISSACSEFSSGSYTWNDGRSCGKMSSLTWEKRLSLGSSAPSNICATLEEQQPTRHKESHILEGLRKLQRRKHRSSSSSSKVSKSGSKDCMNSNEGIYSLGIKSSSKGVSKPTHVGRTLAVGSKKFSYDSDDADDELAHSSRGDNIPTKDNWFYCRRLSHSISDSLCSWEGNQDSGGDGSSGPGAMKHPSGYDSKERPEKLMSFINSFLPEGGRASAFSKPSMLRFNPVDPEGPNHLSDVDDPEELNSESSDIRVSFSHPSAQAERDSKRLSRDAAKLLTQQCLRRDQGRTQSADGRPRPFSLIKEPKGAKCTQSEESILAIFDAEGEPIELCTQKLTGPSKVIADYTELVPQERPTRQKSANARNYTVLESPEKPSEYQIRTSKTSSSRDGSAERLSMQLTPQRKLIKPPSSRPNKGHSIPPIIDSAGPKSSSSKIPGRNKPSGSPLRLSKGSTTEPCNSANSGPSGQEKSPSSPIVKISKFIKTPGTCSQSPKAVNSKLPSRGEWNKGSSSSSPHLSRRHLEYADNGEQPTRDKHCETSKNKLRSPSPPPPPGRTTSLLIRPNYEGSPQAHKTWVAPPSAPTTMRGPPPSYHTSLVPNMQNTLPIKDKDCLDLDAGYGTALAPQKLVDKTSQHLQKSPAMTQTPTKGTSKRMTTKDYLPPANSGCAPETEKAPKSSKNVPPPYSALRGSSLQNSFASKRGSIHENVHQTVQKTSISLPISLQDTPQGKTEPQNGKAVISPPSSIMLSPNTAEKASKTRIPMGFKAFLKSPPSHKNSLSIPGKQEKDHINLVSKETVTSNASTQCDSLQPVYSIDSPPKMSITEGKGEVQCRSLEEEVQAAVLPEERDICEGKRSSQLFSRSISVSTKPHLKPALGMNGAKARSQSFSTNYIEKPNINALDGPGKIRTQIITNSGERGNSLSRQSSLEVPSVGLAESPVLSPRTRLSHYGGMTGSNSHNVIPERTYKSGSKGEGSHGTVNGEAITSPQKEVRSLPISDRIGLKNIRKPAKVASHPQFQPPSSENPMRETGSLATPPNEPDFSREAKTQTDSPSKAPDVEEKKNTTATVCTIEEKVMMGIEENLQKCQEQEKVAANETKQKTGPSLANWFGLRKTKLPALSGKKADSPKGKEEKKDLKIGSVLGGKQMKSDKKRDKKKNENHQKESQEVQNLSEMNNKLSSIMDHCNNQMGQIASQIQCTTAFIGKDQFVKELLGRTAVKGNYVAASPAGISTPKKHGEMKGDVEICPDTDTLIMTQKINLRAENEEGHIPDTACQDHLLGSSCQMRTLDSGIGTFPLPDSVTRASGRHIPKSESSPDGVTASSSKLHREFSSSHPDPSQPDVKVPSLPKTHLHAPTSMGHSLSDPTCSNNAQDTQSRLPKLATSDAIRTKRLSLGAPRSNISTEDKGKETERKMKTKDHDMPGERALQVCTYSGSSSDTETEPEGTGSTLGSPQRTLINRAKKSDSVDQNEETLKRSSMEKSLSIMDFYQHDAFSHLEDSRRISQYNLLHKESSLDGKAGDRLSKEIPMEKTPISANQPGSLDFSLESLNKLNHSSSSNGSLYPDTGLGGRRGNCHANAGKSREDCCKGDEPSSSSFSSKPGADPVGSLSDSLYDSFSSCTSQGSNDV
ncbi:nck-associated protein 5-like isoform X2 [Micropterus dolomieu]|uniref:nck-associated protein 5-like isoform X2 n=1 Tax=Micropterus dolomieu TaxID=147949 RepID=UPI001E8DB2FA|nr:nck-associated protein 5-like isoform X2 [Micropterus dolomieu]XP_045915767.1 nck-associated protein 5-like isoform X2 [Micropterus dolomieu]XP_045915774.1 nck-associated protein 5-like isoform X2 [Micropterus dolomieu]